VSLFLGVLLLALMIRVSVMAGVMTVKAVIFGWYVLVVVAAWLVSRNMSWYRTHHDQDRGGNQHHR
jgi:membrane protein implicated in regulation of membrane protease activity